MEPGYEIKNPYPIPGTEYTEYDITGPGVDYDNADYALIAHELGGSTFIRAEKITRKWH
jgi:hypothetical protein